MKTTGQIAFEAYAEAKGGTTYDGKKIPGWNDLDEGDPVRRAWQVAADAAVAANQENPTKLVEMNFAEAMLAMLHGRRVRRTGWNGKGMWVAIRGAQDGSTIRRSPTVLSPREEFYPERGCIVMKDAQDWIVVGWLASQTDMLSGDWEVVSAEE